VLGGGMRSTVPMRAAAPMRAASSFMMDQNELKKLVGYKV